VDIRRLDGQLIATGRARSESWSKLVPGGRFMDRILPAPIYRELRPDAWGADAATPNGCLVDPAAFRIPFLTRTCS
jgi:hypothetical protein